jgi:hypothetical protein
MRCRARTIWRRLIKSRAGVLPVTHARWAYAVELAFLEWIRGFCSSAKVDILLNINEKQRVLRQIFYSSDMECKI